MGKHPVFRLSVLLPKSGGLSYSTQPAVAALIYAIQIKICALSHGVSRSTESIIAHCCYLVLLLFFISASSSCIAVMFMERLVIRMTFYNLTHTVNAINAIVRLHVPLEGMPWTYTYFCAPGWRRPFRLSGDFSWRLPFISPALLPHLPYTYTSIADMFLSLLL